MSKWLVMSVLMLVLAPAPAALAAKPRDRDHDGLPDRWEKRYHLSTHHNSRRGDADHDGLANLGEYRHHTNPRKRDTDGDGLTDGAEVHRYHTNPRKRDTDGDGVPDGQEVRAGSNPTSATSVPAGAPGVAPPAPGSPGWGPVGPQATTVPCTVNATTANLSATLAAAGPGAVICVAAGDYGSFSGASKAGLVTIRPQPGAAASLRLNLSGASNIALDGFSIGGGSVSGSTHNVVIRNSAFTNAVVITYLANANVTFDHDSFNNIGSSDDAARIHLSYSGSTPSGVTISNSLLAGGDSDGVQTGVGVTIVGNEFRDILENGANHTDNIQLIEAPGAVVRDNWVHQTQSGSTQGITAFNGLDHGLIEDNVVDLSMAGMRPWGIELQQDVGSIVRHNTLVYGPNCDFNLPCGLIAIRAQSSGTTVVDNIATRVDVLDGSTVTRGHNLLRQSASGGDLLGVPVFAGGAHPTGFDGYRLSAGSPGRGASSGGGDVGIN
jgi:Bacterial TSP3 repeat